LVEIQKIKQTVDKKEENSEMLDKCMYETVTGTHYRAIVAKSET
jgi:hypothetical protein